MPDDCVVEGSEPVRLVFTSARVRRCFDGHKHPMPTASPEDFLDEMIQQEAFNYQDGMCAELAHVLIRTFPDSRWVDVWEREPRSAYDDPIHHAVMLDDGRILDSLGLWSREEMRRAWGRDAVVKVVERGDVDMEGPVYSPALSYGRRLVSALSL